jgi:pilus assembly protein Flp/PilA
MNKFVASIRNFLTSEDGPTSVEYAIMLTMILVVCISTVGNIGETNNKNMEKATAAMK